MLSITAVLRLCQNAGTKKPALRRVEQTPTALEAIGVISSVQAVSGNPIPVISNNLQ
jgi:hypothetical protein